jgi:hypothetical protein
MTAPLTPMAPITTAEDLTANDDGVRRTSSKGDGST